MMIAVQIYLKVKSEIILACSKEGRMSKSSGRSTLQAKPLSILPEEALLAGYDRSTLSLASSLH